MRTLCPSASSHLLSYLGLMHSLGYFTIPMGFCDLILKEGGREMPIKTWMEMLEKQIPPATEYFPPAIGHHADDTWEHVRAAVHSS